MFDKFSNIRSIKNVYFFFVWKDDFVAMYGWKALHGDVFRPPGMHMLLSAVLGSGVQITLTIFGTLGTSVRLTYVHYIRSSFVFLAEAFSQLRQYATIK